MSKKNRSKKANRRNKARRTHKRYTNVHAHAYSTLETVETAFVCEKAGLFISTCPAYADHSHLWMIGIKGQDDDLVFELVSGCTISEMIPLIVAECGFELNNAPVGLTVARAVKLAHDYAEEDLGTLPIELASANDNTIIVPTA